MAETLFAILSFTGSDQHSQAGGLGTREKAVARALASLGLNRLQADPRGSSRRRRAGKATARAYLRDSVFRQLFAQLELAAARQGVRPGADT